MPQNTTENYTTLRLLSNQVSKYNYIIVHTAALTNITNTEWSNSRRQALATDRQLWMETL